MNQGASGDKPNELHKNTRKENEASDALTFGCIATIDRVTGPYAGTDCKKGIRIVASTGVS